jgi:hypothetical protein
MRWLTLAHTTPRSRAPLDTAEERLGSRHVVLARKQKGDVDGHPGEDRFLDGREAFLRAGDLDQQVGSPCLRVQMLGCHDGAGRVVRQ